MKLLLDVKDDKAAFLMELLQNFKFVKTEEVTSHKEEVLDNIREAVEEMKLIKAGKAKGIPAKDLLDEL